MYSYAGPTSCIDNISSDCGIASSLLPSWDDLKRIRENCIKAAIENHTLQKEALSMKVSYKTYEGQLLKLERCDNLIAHDRGWNLTIKDSNGAEITVKVLKLSDITFSGAGMRFEE